MSDLVMSGQYANPTGHHCGTSVAVGGCEDVWGCVGEMGGGEWSCGDDQ